MSLIDLSHEPISLKMGKDNQSCFDSELANKVIPYDVFIECVTYIGGSILLTRLISSYISQIQSNRSSITRTVLKTVFVCPR